MRAQIVPSQRLSETNVAPADACRPMTALRRLVRALRSADSGSDQTLGVTIAQLFVLRQIASCPGLSLRELATRTATTQSSVSEVVERLAGRGLVARRVAAEDRRRTELTLTAQGAAMVAQGADHVQERLIAGYLALREEQQRTLADGLDAWVAACGLEITPATMFGEPLAPLTDSTEHTRIAHTEQAS
jgi:DNA-binding MarR family transcriptional regulator